MTATRPPVRRGTAARAQARRQPQPDSDPTFARYLAAMLILVAFWTLLIFGIPAAFQGGLIQ